MTSDAGTGFIPEVEAALLGALLLGGDHAAVLALVDERHFIEPSNAAIFAAIRQAHERFSTTTVPVVFRLIPDEAKALFKASAGVEIGQYLAECTSTTMYTAGTAMRAARNVIAQWARVTLGQEAALIAEAARDPNSDPVELMRGIGSMVDAVGSEVRRGGRGRSRSRFSVAAAATIAASRDAKARGGLTGITTGLIDLDRLTGGLQRRDLILLGARPSMGKTTVGTAIALSAAQHGHGVGILSLEMDTQKLMARMCSDLAFRRGVKVPYENIINGSAPESDIANVEWALKEFHTLPIWIDDAAGLTIAEVRAKVEAMVAEAQEGGFTIDLLVVDHLLKIASSSRYAGNRVNEIAEITGGLKELAREFDLALLLLTQLNRAVEQRDDKRPQLSDLRDSGAIEQDADTVMFLYRDAYYLQREKPESAGRQIDRDDALRDCINKAEIEIAKQRNGRTQTIDLFVDMAHANVGNAVRGGYAEMHERYNGGAGR